jgi:hypothetical protein
MGTAYVQTGTAVTANNLIVVVYNSSTRALVAQSSAMSASAGTGLQSAAISGTLVGGTQYFLDVLCDSGYWNSCYNSGSSAFQVDYNTAANNPYSSPLTTLPTADGTLGHEFIVWIDGSTSTPVGNPLLYTRRYVPYFF